MMCSECTCTFPSRLRLDGLEVRSTRVSQSRDLPSFSHERRHLIESVYMM